MSTEDTRQHSREPRPSGALRPLDQSTKLQNVLYEIRGPVNAEAERMEADGQRILKLNTGNPAAFGFDAPDTIVQDMIAALPYAQGYSQSKGIPSARRAVVSRYEVVPGFPTFDVEDVFIGNGVSELITMTTQALLNDGDEVLFWDRAMDLVGTDGATHTADGEATSAYDSDADDNLIIPPGETANVKIVYDVPIGTSPESATVRISRGGDETTGTLPL